MDFAWIEQERGSDLGNQTSKKVPRFGSKFAQKLPNVCHDVDLSIKIQCHIKYTFFVQPPTPSSSSLIENLFLPHMIHICPYIKGILSLLAILTYMMYFDPLIMKNTFFFPKNVILYHKFALFHVNLPISRTSCQEKSATNLPGKKCYSSQNLSVKYHYSPNLVRNYSSQN